MKSLMSNLRILIRIKYVKRFCTPLTISHATGEITIGQAIRWWRCQDNNWQRFLTDTPCVREYTSLSSYRIHWACDLFYSKQLEKKYLIDVLIETRLV